MRITGARVAFNATTAEKADLWVDRGRVWFSQKRSSHEPGLDLSGYLILPGLINAHDHLELNLFPRLGRGIYSNATVWAADIYQPDKSPVKEQLAVPKSARFRWGAIKNLLSGVTTAAHHNPLPSLALRRKLPIRVLSRYGWAHSVHFSHDWRHRFHATPERYPFIVHAAEGTDDPARKEIELLKAGGLLTASTVLVHGVAIGPDELKSLAESGCSLVWCPSSNYFTLGRSLGREVLNARLPIALGTDSALTGKGDLLDELRFARATLCPQRLYAMVTSTAAQVLKLPPGFGEICDRGPADLLIVRDDGLTPAETLVQAVPQLVFIKGRVELVSAAFSPLNIEGLVNRRSLLKVENRGAYFLRRPVASLIRRTRDWLGYEPRLAGKAVA